MPRFSISGLSPPRAALFEHPWLRRVFRLLCWSAVGLYFLVALLVLAIRVAILPEVDRYRDDIAQVIGEAMGQRVGIRAIDAHWSGLRPVLNLHGIEIHDAAGRPVLGFEQVTAEPGWSSLWHGEARFARLELAAPRLLLRRDPAGRLFAAGLDITPKDTDSRFGQWLLTQDRIIIRNAAIVWQDELRQAPPLELKNLNLLLDNGWRSHRFGLTAEPPTALAAALDIRGKFSGDDVQRLDVWTGEAYVHTDRIDLAGWRPWLDYPIKLAQGGGALRLWLDFAEAQITAATADVRLSDTRLRLRDDLPELDLTNLNGRVSMTRLTDELSLATRQLALATRDGAHLPATDFSLRWRPPGKKAPQGDITANHLDFDVLRRLASHLPLPETVQAQIVRHAPQGRLDDLHLNWHGAFEQLDQWSIKGRMQQLGLRDFGPLAAVTGISGEIAGDQRSGVLRLDARQSTVELPTVFAEPRIALDSFSTTANWKNTGDGLQVELTQASFANPDVAGEASGTWQAANGNGGGPGRIDLTGQLTRANGATVWRYMPLAVGQDARNWLRTGIRGGVASDVKLTLKGDLKDFPFRSADASRHRGIFEVRGAFRDATLDYADGWPAIAGIDGTLLFAGERMLITASSGKVFSVGLSNVRAEIADLESYEELLTVTGQVSGPTADFLRYIDASPISGYIDGFTKDMRAEGNGLLTLKLDLPLRKMENTKIAGEYRFDGNRLTVDNQLPPLDGVRGTLRFSEKQIEARDLRGTLFGMPWRASLKTAADRGLDVAASGEFAVAALRRQLSHPVLDNLSGSTKWTSTIRIQQKTAAIKVTSNLVGLSSSLPEPFNKSAGEILPLSLERRLVEAETTRKVGADGTADRRPPRVYPREILSANLGQRAQLRLVRRQDTDPPQIVWGRMAVADNIAALSMDAIPESTARGGFQINVDLPRLDGDAWGRLSRGNSANEDASSDSSPLPTIQMNLRIGEFNLFDQTLHELHLNGQSVAGAARFNPKLTLKSREINGSLEWLSGGPGRLNARLDKFSLTKPEAPAPLLQVKATEVIDQLPALDLQVEDFAFEGRSLGKLRLTAENDANAWNARIGIDNDDDNLQGTARWQPRTSNTTQLQFKLKTRNIDRFLQRIGYDNVIRRGNASTSGTLTWRGPPFHIDYPSLDGKFELKAANGQFNKLEPGVGRLLGILSLQSLPRRITLDFRDIFSEGLAFNAIDGNFTVTGGVTRTEDLNIRGPAANIVMAGAIDLGAETQNLRVLIQPAVSDSVSVGAMIANPAVGAAVWAAQKLFKDPLGKVLAYEYRITGPWADPQVVKSGSATSSAATEGAEK